MPDKIDTYYEPFCGGASVLFKLLHSNKQVGSYICSDVNSDLINLWNEIKNNKYKLLSDYKKMWVELNKDNDIDRRKQYFYQTRSRFNKERDPSDFLFLSRTCVNGLIRYNSKGEFNTSLHFSRGGIVPETLEEIIVDWSNKLNEYNVQFICQSYSKINAGKDDYIYVDPPYANTKGIYFGTIDHEELWNWLRAQPCKYMLSFNGKRASTDNTYNVPKDLYNKHEYVHSGRSSFKDYKEQKVEYVQESLYLKIG